MRTEKITSVTVGNPALRRLYESAFPREEQIPYDDLISLLDTMPIDFTAYYDGDTFVGLTLVLNRPDFNWGWYFAVQESLRGQGYGQRILSVLKKQYAARPLVIDIESPWQQDCPNQEQRLRRYGFYRRNGFRDTPTFKSFDGIDFTIMLLGEGTFTQQDYDDIIHDLRMCWTSAPQEKNQNY